MFGRNIIESNNAIVQFILRFGEVKMAKCSLKSRIVGDKSKLLTKLKQEKTAKNRQWIRYVYQYIVDKYLRIRTKSLSSLKKRSAYHGGRNLMHQVSQKLSKLWSSGRSV